MAYDFDVIVIGSGITGGWAAKELTEKGFKTFINNQYTFFEDYFK